MRRNLRRIIESFQLNDKVRLLPNRSYRTEPENSERNKKPVHPYKNLHPWKSIEEFSKSLIDNVIYNRDGVVVLNKPYGISNSRQTIISEDRDWNLATTAVPNSVDYTLGDALEDVSKKLGYSSLMIVKSPERFTSGIAILADNESKADAVKKSLARSQCSKTFGNSYWVVTSRVPKSYKGELSLGITKKESPCKTYKQPVILPTWKSNEVKRGEVKVFDVRYQIISNSNQNLASLLEIKCYMTKWHAIRVFASTVLLSPILGDRIHGSRVKKIMGTYLNISPFVEAARDIPILEQALLHKLRLTPDQRVIIPTHIHLREMLLTSFFSRGKDLRLVAPLPPGFQWTCDQLQFKIPNEGEELDPQLRIATAQ